MTKVQHNISPDFLHRFANWQGLNSLCLTIDTDFAPEFMIADVISALREHGLKATIFATHESHVLKSLAGDPQFEIGTHPNLSEGSTQGGNLKDIITSLRQTYGPITGNRFHVLKHSYRDLVTLGELGFVYDVSSLRFNCSHLLPAWHQDLNMTLLTYCWEDGVCENAGLPLDVDHLPLGTPGIKILNFHPVNIYINGPDSAARLAFLKNTPKLTECPREQAEPFRQKGPGAGSVFLDLLRYVEKNGVETFTLQELSQQFASKTSKI